MLNWKEVDTFILGMITSVLIITIAFVIVSMT
jgi:hypothetical protein